MKKLPIVGVILHCQNAIAVDGKPIYTKMHKTLRLLDQSVLNGVFDRCRENYGSSLVAVVGSNTFKELENTYVRNNMDERVVGYVISSDSSIEYASSCGGLRITLYKFADDDTREQKKSYLRRMVQTMLLHAFGTKDDSIKVDAAVVIGGAAVYESFEFEYNEIHISEVISETALKGELKTVEVDVMIETIKSRVADTNVRNKGGVKTPYSHTIIDDPEYTYKVYRYE